MVVSLPRVEILPDHDKVRDTARWLRRGAAGNGGAAVKTDKPFRRSKALAIKAARERKEKVVADLMSAAQMAARRLQGQHATWINVGTKADRSGVIITTMVGGI